MLAQLLVARPDSASEAVHVMFTVWSTVYVPALPAYEISGGVLSMLAVALVAAALPARSRALPATFWPAPSAVRATGAAQMATPDRASLQLNAMVTSVLFHPAALAGGIRDATMTGGVLSMLIEPTVAVVWLPARSLPWPETLWLAPSADSVVGGEQNATPDSASEQAKVTATGVLFHPATLGPGRRVASTVGAVRSMRS